MVEAEDITCPYCNERQDWDGDIWRMVALDCEKCGKRMYVEIEKITNYYSSTQEEYDERERLREEWFAEQKVKKEALQADSQFPPGEIPGVQATDETKEAEQNEDRS